MKIKKWVLLLLTALFLVLFWQYRLYDAHRTDTDAPEITMEDAQVLQVSVQDPKSALLRGISARDERDGDLTGKLVVESMQLINDEGLIEVGYAVADLSGNVAKAVRKAQYVDYSSPQFRLNRPLIYREHDNFDIMSAVGATDLLDGDIQHRIRATSLTEESIFSLGVHEVYFQVTNSIGDTAELVMPVEVQRPGQFDAELTLTDYLIYLPVGASFRARDYLGTFTHRDEVTPLGGGLPRNYQLKTNGEVSTDVPGVYPVEYRVTYTVKHETNPEYDQKFTGYSRLIVVVEG